MKSNSNTMILFYLSIAAVTIIEEDIATLLHSSCTSDTKKKLAEMEEAF